MKFRRFILAVLFQKVPVSNIIYIARCHLLVFLTAIVTDRP